ncbi:hypothetical protein H2204_002128 [Knufia peltigerae]|uniref:Uncharacterized protein n=1 Tax=Knufia peltigerae TaxID=1002370 RepID=A0AA38YBQ3_9EURO|nr:hypothetical protein H2204_002128 [Knufia peltigerae]
MAPRDETVPERSLISSYYGHDDLDLNALFRRLDRHAAEVEAIEAGLKQMNPFPPDSVTEGAHQRFSFEENESLTSAEMAPGQEGEGTRKRSYSTNERLPCLSSGDVAEHVNGAVLVGDQKGHPIELNHTSQTHHSVYLKPSRCKACGKRKAPSPFEAPLDQPSNLPHCYEPQLPTSDWSMQRHFVLPKRPPTPRVHDTRRSTRSAEVDGGCGNNGQANHEEDYFTDSEPDEPNSPTSNATDYDMIASWPFPPESPTSFTTVQLLPSRSSSLSPKTVKVHPGNHAERPPKRKERLTVNCTEPLPENRERSSLVSPLSHTGSLATAATLSPPPTPILVCSPYEDQLRRELEIQVLQEGPEALELKYKPRGPLTLNVVDDDDDDDDDGEREGEVGHQNQDKTALSTLLLLKDNGRPQLKRRETILGIFRKRSPVERFIDMYLDDDDAAENKVPRRTRSMRPWRRSPGHLKAPDVPPIPTMPRIEQPSG